jgi:hypothetical protein
MCADTQMKQLEGQPEAAARSSRREHVSCLLQMVTSVCKGCAVRMSCLVPRPARWEPHARHHPFEPITLLTIIPRHTITSHLAHDGLKQRLQVA